MPPFMRFFPMRGTAKNKNKSKSKSKSESKSKSFSPATKNRIANFTRKRDSQRLKRDGEILFRIIKNIQAKNNCPICHDTMLNNGPTRTTPCKHTFHSECLDTWLRRKNTCPLCRERIQEPVIVPYINRHLAQQIADANDDAYELAILQMVETYWTEQGRRPVEVELLKLCKLAVLKLSRLVRCYSRTNTNAYTTAQANARNYAAVNRLDLDYYYSLEDTYNPQLPLAPPVAPPPPPPAPPPPPPAPIPIISPNLSVLRTAYTI